MKTKYSLLFVTIFFIATSCSNQSAVIDTKVKEASKAFDKYLYDLRVNDFVSWDDYLSSSQLKFKKNQAEMMGEILTGFGHDIPKKDRDYVFHELIAKHYPDFISSKIPEDGNENKLFLTYEITDGKYKDIQFGIRMEFEDNTWKIDGVGFITSTSEGIGDIFDNEVTNIFAGREIYKLE